VEILACGDDERVTAFVEWLWIGSSASKVTSVEVDEAACNPLGGRAGFHTI
jgi:acylphosphatase